MLRLSLRWLICFCTAGLLLLPLNRPTVKAQECQAEYLIIAPDEFQAALGDFIDLKTRQGFQVQLTLLSTVGESKEEIKAFIQSCSPLPKYVLLIGDTEVIPSWPATLNAGMTDLFYTTFDGSTDFVPNTILGRLPVTHVNELTDLISKYTAYDNAPINAPWRKKAAFISTDAISWVTAVEKKLDATLSGPMSSNHFYGTFSGRDGTAPSTIGGDRLYPRTYKANKLDLLTAVNDGRNLVVYTGGGSPGEWLWKVDETLTRADVSTLTGPPVPLVLALAQNTASLSIGDSMADAWLRNPIAGALVYVGASTTTTTVASDLLLQEIFFNYLFDSPAAPKNVGESLHKSLKFISDNSPGIGRQYWEAYQILGDPSLQVIPPIGGELVSPSTHYEGTLNQWIDIPLALTNRGPDPADFTLSIAADGDYESTLDMLQVSLNPGQTAVISGKVRISDQYPAGTTGWITVSASLAEITTSIRISIQVFEAPPSLIFLPFINQSASGGN